MRSHKSVKSEEAATDLTGEMASNRRASQWLRRVKADAAAAPEGTAGTWAGKASPEGNATH
jgi:hypothetical protein